MAYEQRGERDFGGQGGGGGFEAGGGFGRGRGRRLKEGTKEKWRGQAPAILWILMVANLNV
ncbi:hypothetical protein M7I_7320 [Glarea lozoyensis 74030]|uniref:Uncharacterized protein n=1 Tax=Glarea lozoyensis (strain ATCC 74030 / MF5533) TaxID=1104152 RepID=H0EWZ5_GLAL7|nr:hypothetical protein M7I_7320 [Glarea lozoyensis 74030]